MLGKSSTITTNHIDSEHSEHSKGFHLAEVMAIVVDFDRQPAEHPLKLRDKCSRSSFHGLASPIPDARINLAPKCRARKDAKSEGYFDNRQIVVVGAGRKSRLRGAYAQFPTLLFAEDGVEIKRNGRVLRGRDWGRLEGI